MGVDVNLYVVDNAETGQKELDLINRWLMDRGVHGYDPEDWDNDHNAPPLGRDNYEPKHLEWKTLSRFYGPGYERGHWPNIYNGIVCIRAAFPDYEIHYGGDTTLAAPRVTDGMLQKYWDHWLSDDGREYYKKHVRLNQPEGSNT